jgi:hypothetical protein
VSATPDKSTSITFELERLEVDGPGRLVVHGRWYGVRGRRFVRPTLTMTMHSDGSERRALADLEHKPWAAEDGEPWIAAFPVDVKPAEARMVELSVAPDVAVELAPGDPRPEALDARTPRVRGDRVPARRSATDASQEIERLRLRLQIAERAVEREHARRAELDQALEEERAKSRRLAAELGELRGQLDVAAATWNELSTASAELDATRGEARETAGRLRAAMRALDQQRAESEHLRTQVTAAEATIQRLSQARETELSARFRTEGDAVPGPEDVTAPIPAQRRAAPEPPAHPEPAGAPLRAGAPVGRARQELHHPLPERPLNPSLRSRRNWLGRMLALIVIAAVIAAIILVINSTVARAAGF